MEITQKDAKSLWVKTFDKKNKHYHRIIKNCIQLLSFIVICTTKIEGILQLLTSESNRE